MLFVLRFLSVSSPCSCEDNSESLKSRVGDFTCS